MVTFMARKIRVRLNMNEDWVEWLAWGLLIAIAFTSIYLEVKRI